jgi:hypothetical protein
MIPRNHSDRASIKDCWMDFCSCRGRWHARSGVCPIVNEACRNTMYVPPYAAAQLLKSIGLSQKMIKRLEKKLSVEGCGCRTIAGRG